MSEFLIAYYDVVLTLLQVMGGEAGVMGFGYYVVNIVLFVFVQPGLAILFFILWMSQKKNNEELRNQRLVLLTSTSKRGEPTDKL